MSIIHGIQTIKSQRKWMEKQAPKEVMDHLFNKTEEEYIHLCNELK